MSQVAQLCLAASGLLKQPGIGIRRALVGLVLPCLPVKIDILRLAKTLLGFEIKGLRRFVFSRCDVTPE